MNTFSHFQPIGFLQPLLKYGKKYGYTIRNVLFSTMTYYQLQRHGLVEETVAPYQNIRNFESQRRYFFTKILIEEQKIFSSQRMNVIERNELNAHIIHADITFKSTKSWCTTRFIIGALIIQHLFVSFIHFFRTYSIHYYLIQFIITFIVIWAVVKLNINTILVKGCNITKCHIPLN